MWWHNLLICSVLICISWITFAIGMLELHWGNTNTGIQIRCNRHNVQKKENCYVLYMLICHIVLRSHMKQTLARM
jgi:hypothetical protein